MPEEEEEERISSLRGLGAVEAGAPAVVVAAAAA